MKKLQLLVYLFIGSITQVPDLYSQAFNTFNGRNHPEIKWMEITTPHFEIMYPKHLEGIEMEAATIAEETYNVLSQTLETEFDRKIRIYLSDEDEIVNGAATFLNDSYTFIWVGLNDASLAFSGRSKWLRTVLSHELAHIFNFEALHSNMGIWGFLFGDTGTRSMTEGYAQFASEKWNAKRGDANLRRAIFDDKPNPYDGRTPTNGRLIYSSGYSQMLFLAEQYGDSTIRNMFAYRDTLFLGLTYPNVYAGFKESTGEEWDSFLNRWKKHVNIHYNTLAGQLDRTDSLSGKKLNINGQLLIGFKVSPSGKKAVATVFKSMERPYQETYRFEKDSTGFKRKESLFLGGTNGDFSFSDDETKIVYSKIVRAKNGALVNDVFEYDLTNKKESRLTKDARISSPIFIAKESYLGIQNTNGTGNIVRFKRNSKSFESLTNYSGDTQVLQLSINPQKNQLAFMKFDSEGNRTIEVLDIGSKKITSYTNPNHDDQYPIFSPDGNSLAFTSYRDKVANIFKVKLGDTTQTRLTHVFTGATLYDWSLHKTDSTNQSTMYLLSSESKEYDYLWAVPDTFKTNKDIVTYNKTYASWMNAEPSITIPQQISTNKELILSRNKANHFSKIEHAISFGYPYFGEDENGDIDAGIFGISTWFDPLGKHQFSLVGNVSFTNNEETYGVFSYINNTQSFSWNIDAYRIPATFQFYGQSSLYSQLNGFSTGITQPIDWPYRPYTSSSFNLQTRAFLWEPFTFSTFTDNSSPSFNNAWQTDLILGYGLKYVRPYAFNDVHPLSAAGVYFAIKSGLNAEDQWFGEQNSSTYGIFNVQAFHVTPIISELTFFTYARAEAQVGEPLAFESVQLARYDNIVLPVLEGSPIQTWNTPNRVRGYRVFVLADQLGFMSNELRVPLIRNLGTDLLWGLISFEKTTATLFSDMAFAGNPDYSFHTDPTLDDSFFWGLGAELKNKLFFFGLPIVHAAGFGQKYNELFGSEMDWHYRIQASIPF